MLVTTTEIDSAIDHRGRGEDFAGAIPLPGHHATRGVEREHGSGIRPDIDGIAGDGWRGVEPLVDGIGPQRRTGDRVEHMQPDRTASEDTPARHCRRGIHIPAHLLYPKYVATDGILRQNRPVDGSVIDDTVTHRGSGEDGRGSTGLPAQSAGRRIDRVKDAIDPTDEDHAIAHRW